MRQIKSSQSDGPFQGIVNVQLVSDKELDESSTHLAAGLEGKHSLYPPLALPSLNRGKIEEEVRPSWEAQELAY